MKKLIIFTLIFIMGIGLSGCSLFQNTTTVTTENVVVDTDNFIQVNTVDDLQNIEMNKSYILEADLDLTGVDWTPIGTLAKPYRGIFDGNGHTISNLSIDKPNGDFNGLFGYLQGTVKDLNITDFDIEYTTNFLTYAGGLAGYLIGDVTNVNTSGTINITSSASNIFVGLLVGLSQAQLDSNVTVDSFEPNILQNNTVSGDITVSPTNFAYVGGLAGKAYNTEILDNTASGTINVSGGDYHVYTGGLVGHYYGGILVGFEKDVESTDILIQNNVTNEEITVTSAENGASVGGLIGYSQYGVISNNAAFSDIQVDGNTLYVGGYTGENWHSVLEKLIVDTSLNVTVGTETTVYSIGTIIGKDFTETEISDGFYVFDSSNTTFDAQGMQTTFSNFQNSSWLQTTLGWESDYYNKILAITNS